MLGETYDGRKSTQPKQNILLIKKPELEFEFMSVFFFTWCFPVKNQAFQIPDGFDLRCLSCGLWTPEADRADLPHIVEVLVPPQRSTDVPSRDDLGLLRLHTPKINIAPEDRQSQKESSLPTTNVRGLCCTSGGVWVVSLWMEDGWRYAEKGWHSSFKPCPKFGF